MALSATLLGIGLLLALLATDNHHTTAVSAPVLAALLLPIYVATHYYTLDFEFRGETFSLTLVHLPLALGVLLVGPVAHVVVRLAAAVVRALARRQAPVRALFNVAAGAFEVGVAAFAVGLVPSGADSGPVLWLALYVGLLVGELVPVVVLALIWCVLRLPMSFSQAVRPLAAAAPVTLVFTGIAIVTFTALMVEPWTGPVMVGLVAGLGLAYRAHRKAVGQQQTTEELYDFVKDLGPLDADSARAQAVLEQVRVLLKARYLDLAVCEGESWRHLVVWEGGPQAEEPRHLVALAEQVAASGTAALRGRSRTGNGDEMATPLLTTGGLMGILTASHRLGESRGFDLRDLRLLETVAAELRRPSSAAGCSRPSAGRPRWTP
jgi:hypothetical protein